MIHALIAIVTGNIKLRQYLKTCLLTEKTDERECFSYRGRFYDLDKFVELVRQDFSRLTVQDRLTEVKALVDGLENSVHPELDRAYIEAYRQTLEGFSFPLSD